MDARPRVGLFVTCLVDLHRPNVGFAAIRLLEAAGCEVVVPERQTCCGQPAFNSGDRASSRAIARQTIAAFEAAEVEHVVAPSGSCAGMLREHYPTLFGTAASEATGELDDTRDRERNGEGDRERAGEHDGGGDDERDWARRASAFAARCHELTSFLVDVLGRDDVAAALGARLAATVTYHDSCAGLRELGVKRQPRALLGGVADLDIAEMDDTEVCCGFGGTFCVKFPDISERMADDKIALAAQSGAEVLLGGDLGCLLAIGGRLTRRGQPMRLYHVAEVLAGVGDVPPIGHPER